MEAQLINTAPQQADRNKPNYGNFFNERRATPQTIQRSTVNNRFTYETAETAGDYLEYAKLERNPNLRIRTRRVQSLNIGAALKNILYGATTWHEDATNIVASIYAVEDGKGTISDEGWFVPSANFKSEGIAALAQPIPLTPLVQALKDLMLDEIQRPVPTDLEIMSRQVDVIREFRKAAGTKFNVKLSRSFMSGGVSVSISPTAFRYDSDVLNVWRILTGNAYAIQPAAESLINHWTLLTGRYVGQAESDRFLHTFELPNADPNMGWTALARYNYWNAGHASARVASFIISQSEGLL